MFDEKHVYKLNLKIKVLNFEWNCGWLIIVTIVWLETIWRNGMNQRTQCLRCFNKQWDFINVSKTKTFKICADSDWWNIILKTTHMLLKKSKQTNITSHSWRKCLLFIVYSSLLRRMRCSVDIFSKRIIILM